MAFHVAHDVLQAVHKVFSNRSYVVVAFVVWITIVLLFYYLAIHSVPGNDIEFFLSVSKPHELLALLVTSLLMAVLAAMNSKILRMHWRDMKTAGVGLGAIAANIVNLILISATCTACFAALAGAVAAPILFALFQYRVYAIAFSFLLLFSSFYYASRKILNKCEYCKITHHENGKRGKR